MDSNAFVNPPKTVRPMVRWWWPGLDVRPEELVRELEEMDQAGIGGAELQPFGVGLPPDLAKTDPGRAARTHRFMQPYHYTMLQHVIEEASKRGMFIDITQNSSWPTGGTHIPPEDSLFTLLFGQKTVTGPQAWQGNVPPVRPFRLYFFFGTLLPTLVKGLHMLDYPPGEKKLLKVVAGRFIGKPGKFSSWRARRSTGLELASMVDLTGRVDASGVLHWEVPEGTWAIFAMYQGSAGARPLMDARSGPGKQSLVVDHFDRGAELRHLEAFLGQARAFFGNQFGRTFRAVFTDSFELISPMIWKRGFLEEFKRRRGYDIAPYLPAMYIPLKDVAYYTYYNEIGLPNFDFAGDAGQRMRWDFQRTLSELFVEEFIDTFASWARTNGLKSRVQGYGMRADPLGMLGHADIPETEQLYGGGALNFLKLAGAAGTLYERPIVTSETLVWLARTYMTTPLKWRVALDRLYESGINQVIYHGFPYNHPAYAHPGYHPFSTPYLATMTFSSDMSRNDPLLSGAAPMLNAYAARAQSILQHSRTSSRVGIFYQLFDYPNGDYIQEELVQGVLDEQDAQLPRRSPLVNLIMPSEQNVTGDRKWIKDTAALGRELVAHGHYPLYFNEDCLLRSHIEGKRVAMGEAAFEALILFREGSLTVEAAEKLKEIAAAGIPVLFEGRRPDCYPGYFEHETHDRLVREAIAVVDGPVFDGSEAILAALLAASVRPEVRYEGPQHSFGFIHKIDRQDGSEYFFLRNRTRDERVLTMILVTEGKVPVLLDLWTGRMGTLPYEAAGSEIRLTLDFAGYESKMILLTDPLAVQDLPTAPAPVMREDLEPIVRLGNFSFAADQRLLNGASQRIEMQLAALRDWREIPQLAALSDPGEYSATFALDKVDLGRRYFLQFERVCDRADVILNGHALPPLLVMPWRCEISAVLREGENWLQVTVTPTLRNRLVAYAHAGSKDHRQYKRQPTMPSGLIGGVMVAATRA